MAKILISLILFVYLPNAWSETSEDGFFSGRISKINHEINTVRVRVDFDNVKYLNVKDRLTFWDDKNVSAKCKAIILGRTADYILLKVPEMKYCIKNIYFTTGSYFKFFSEDLVNNIKMGKEVVTILLKKRQAVTGQMEIKNRDLLAHAERVNATNARYQTLKEKLEEEWKRELHNLEEDKTYTLRSYKDLEIRRDEIDQKLELYKVKDENLTLDRWSLDTNLYYKK
jgi:hypothetical protein